MSKMAKNPIISGFSPDPSICRVDDDYYLVTSTFAYFPGVPIYHSKDLINWKQIGNVLDRKEQLPLEGSEHSGGIFAPTIRYHDGTFYMITTNVARGGNFIVTATDPAGPWSDPYYIPGPGGIDPSLFFDDDGKCYCHGTRDRREGAKYYGDNEIWLQELDLETMTLVGEIYAIWHGALKDVVWPEAPHIYKKDGRYYLIIAEAGTAHDHAVTVAVSDDITKPFVGHKGNPILTHRHLGWNYPIVNVGHGDLVETQNGEWYMVLLASRPYGGYYRNLGRETFLVPVVWENGWPLVNPGKGIVEDTIEFPNLPETPVEPLPETEDFDIDKLPHHFIYLRNPVTENYSLDAREGYLRIKLAKEKITEKVSPSYVGIRQTGMSYECETLMEFTPASGEEAGLVLMQNPDFHYRFVKATNGDSEEVQLIRCKEGKEEILSKATVDKNDNNSIRLKITADKQDISFEYSYDGENYTMLQSDVDGRMLSTDVAGGFVGNTMGLYCSSNGQDSENHADFDWLRYKNLDQ